MRRRTITLVVVGLVMALFVLPAAAQTLLNTEVEADEPVEEVTYELKYDYDPGALHVLWGFIEEGSEDDPCMNVVLEFDTDGELIVPEGGFPEGCMVVDIEGPNGQVNHGQFVSNMVHALKDGYNKDTHGPFGQWVKKFAHDEEIGKGEWKVKAEGDEDDDDLVELEAADADDDDGPKDKSEKSNNGNGKGKNK